MRQVDSLPKSTVDKLSELVLEASRLDAEVKEKSARLDNLKDEIRDLVEKHQDRVPVISASRIIPLYVIQKSLRVTYSSLAPVMDYDALRDRIGGEVFQQIARPIKWELAPEDVNQAIQDELVKESDLQACLHDAPARRPSVTFEALKGAKVEVDD